MRTLSRILQVTFALAASVAYACQQWALGACLLSAATTLWVCGGSDEDESDETEQAA